jgi:hypothetical protein
MCSPEFASSAHEPPQRLHTRYVDDLQSESADSQTSTTLADHGSMLGWLTDEHVRDIVSVSYMHVRHVLARYRLEDLHRLSLDFAVSRRCGKCLQGLNSEPNHKLRHLESGCALSVASLRVRARTTAVS